MKSSPHSPQLEKACAQQQRPNAGTSLVAQWLRIRLPMQGTRVQALVREDPTCHGATKPVRHNYRACALEPVEPQLLSPWATTTEARAPRSHALQTREATAMRSPRTTTKSSPLSPQLEKASMQQRRPNAAKNKFIKKKERPNAGKKKKIKLNLLKKEKLDLTS